MIMMLKMPIACLMLLSYSFYFYKKNKKLRTFASKMFEAMEIIRTAKISAPVKIGDIVIKDILGETDIIATSNIE